MQAPGSDDFRRVARRCGHAIAAVLAALCLLVGSDGVARSGPLSTATGSRPVTLAATGFSTPAPPISITPGTLLGSEPLTGEDLPAGSEAWRIEYATTTPDNAPATAVATVLAPASRPGDPMPVIAWNHGAVGLVQHCLPSAMADHWVGLPALDQVLSQGWIVVATDYQTDADGVHPFLIGEGEARSTLDAVRALHQLPELQVDPRTVVWGHSQGGHAALWTGMIAPAYAPEIELRGVAAISPVTTLVSLLERQREFSVAPLLGSWVATAYSAYYPDVAFDAIVTPAAQAPGRELATRCPADPLDSLAIVLLLGELGDAPLLVEPVPDAFRARLQENEPDGAIAAPVLIAQGRDDAVVQPEVTARFVAARCAAGEAITSWTLPGHDHLSLLQPGSPLEAPLIAWTSERLAGTPAPASCLEQPLTG